MKMHTEESGNKIINEVFEELTVASPEMIELKKEIKRRLWRSP